MTQNSTAHSLHGFAPVSAEAVPQFFGMLRRGGPRKTLVICPIGLGNFIMATPSLALLSQEIGAENLHLLALRDGIQQMADLSGYVSRVHKWDPDQETKRQGLKTLLALRRERYDYCISLFPSNNWRYCLYTRFAGARIRIGLDYPNTPLPARLQHFSWPFNPDAHDTDQNCDLVEALLGEASMAQRVQLFPYAPIHPQTEALERENYYVVQPGSSVERGMVEKRLPAGAYSYLAHEIYQEFGLKCLVLGGPEQEGLRQEITSQAPSAIINYPSKDFHQLAALITHARFYLGNDSGLMHIAASLNKRCIIFYGPTDDKRCGPYSSNRRFGEKGDHLILRRSDLACSPCWTAKTVGGNPLCIHGDYRCVTQFPIEKFWPKIRQYIQENFRASVSEART